MILERLKLVNRYNFLWGAIIVVGVFLRLRQYLVNRSFWVDEASLALNIVNRTFSELTLPLDYDQGAPLGFLFIEKILILVFGNHDYILRLFPLFSGLLATYFIYKVASKHLGGFGMIAALLFSISNLMIYYSSELKQYSSDVMMALVLIYFSLQCFAPESRLRDTLILGFVGIASIWISHPAIFILPVIGFLLIVDKASKKEYGSIRWILGIGAVWIFTFLFIYFISLRHLIGNENLQGYWDNNFAPLMPWEHIGWYKNILISILPNINPSFLPKLIPTFNQSYLINFCLVVIFIGGISFLLRNLNLAFILTAPLAIAFIASALHYYPITDRFLYFWFPSLLLIIAEGLRRIYEIISTRLNLKLAQFVYAFIAFVILWTPITSAFYNFLNPPMGEDIKPVLAYLQKNVQNDDIVYVHNGSITPFLYYADSYHLIADEIFLARKSRNFERFVIDVENFRGSDRIWFIFSHIVSCDCEGDSRESRVQAHVDVLDKYGSQLDYFEATRAVTYLYTLNR